MFTNTTTHERGSVLLLLLLLLVSPTNCRRKSSKKNTKKNTERIKAKQQSEATINLKIINYRKNNIASNSLAQSTVARGVEVESHARALLSSLLGLELVCGCGCCPPVCGVGVGVPRRPGVAQAYLHLRLNS